MNTLVTTLFELSWVLIKRKQKQIFFYIFFSFFFFPVANIAYAVKGRFANFAVVIRKFVVLLIMAPWNLVER